MSINTGYYEVPVSYENTSSQDDAPNWWERNSADILSGLGALLPILIGGQKNSRNTPATVVIEKKDNTMTYVAIGLGIILFIITLFWLFKGKR